MCHYVISANKSCNLSLWSDYSWFQEGNSNLGWDSNVGLPDLHMVERQASGLEVDVRTSVQFRIFPLKSEMVRQKRIIF